MIRKILAILIIVTIALTLTGEEETIILPDFTLPDFNNNQVTLSDFQGLIILDFWATWCPPCRVEVPVLQRLYDTYKDRGLHIIAVSSEDIKTQQVFKDRMIADGVPMNYTMLIDKDQSVFRKYAVQGIPTTIFLRDDQTQIFREVGFAAHYEEKFVEIIENNLPQQ